MLDDGSGRAIEVKISRRPQAPKGEVYPSNTLVDNLDVYADWGLASVFVDRKPVAVGTVLKVKGTITKFRERQVELKRVFLVRDTNEEVDFWAGLAKHRSEVLSKPWMLSTAEMKAIHDGIEAEERKEKDRKKARHAKHAKYEERKARSDDKKERQRRRVQEVLDDGALVGSNIIKAPWE